MNANPTPLHSLNSCFQHCRLHRGQRGEKKSVVVLVRAEPGASRHSAHQTRASRHGPVVSRCPSFAVAGANTTRGDPRALPASPWSRGYYLRYSIRTRKIQQNTRVRDARPSLHASTQPHCTLLTCWSWAAHDRSATGTTTTAARWHADRLASAAARGTCIA